MAGAGAFLSPRRVLTCAHVVNEALGRDPYDAERPAGESLDIELHSGDSALRIGASPSVWIPPTRRNGGTGDLAVLDLDEPAPDRLPPVQWSRMAMGQTVRAWHGSGQRRSFADTRVADCEDLVGYLDAPLEGAAIGPGYSGGPLWSREAGAAVGLVVAHVVPEGPFSGQHTVRRSRALPWQAMHDALIKAGASYVVDECAVLPVQPPEAPLDFHTSLEHAAYARVPGVGAARPMTVPLSGHTIKVFVTSREPGVVLTDLRAVVLERRDPRGRITPARGVLDARPYTALLDEDPPRIVPRPGAPRHFAYTVGPDDPELFAVCPQTERWLVTWLLEFHWTFRGSNGTSRVGLAGGPLHTVAWPPLGLSWEERP
ncbi:serine protease [Streptomyces sp. NBC_00445]